jgi:hypothetical protein
MNLIMLDFSAIMIWPAAAPLDRALTISAPVAGWVGQMS